MEKISRFSQGSALSCSFKKSHAASLALRLACVWIVLLTVGQAFGAWSGQDIGTVGIAGNSTYDAGTGVYTINGAGGGLSGEADAFHFVSQITRGDVELTACVTTLSGESPYTQAGISVRGSLEPGAMNATLYVSAQDGVNFSIRNASGDTTVKYLGSPTQSAPIWLRLVKVGNTVAGYMSSDGLAWTLVAKDELLLSDFYYVGLPVSSSIPGTLAQAQVSELSLCTNYPGGMSGMVMWLRADQGVTHVNGAVDGWYDMSGYANDAHQTDSAKQPVLITETTGLKNMPVLRFDGQNDGLHAADNSSLNLSNLSIVAVAKYKDASDSKKLLLGRATQSISIGYGFLNLGAEAYGFSGTTPTYSYGGAFPLDTYGFLSMIHDRSKASQQIQTTLSAVVGGNATTAVYYGNSTATSDNSKPFFLGMYEDATGGIHSPNNCEIAEMLLFNRALSDLELNDLRAYLFQKYGVGQQPTIIAPTATSDSPLPSVYSGSQIITLNDIPGAVIYYTEDGSEPTENPTKRYTGPITVNESKVLKFKAFKPGYASSTTTTLSYTIDSSISTFTHNGLALWLRADYAATDGTGYLDNWPDISGNNNPGQASGANRPLLQTGAINSNPAFHFDGVDDFASIANSTTLNPTDISIFVVAKHASTATGNRPYLVKSNSGMTNGYGLYRNGTDGKTYGFINSYSTHKAGGVLAAGTYGILSSIYDRNTVRVSINGTVFSDSFSTAIANDSSSLYLGSRAGTATSALDCEIAEVLVFKRALSESERTDVEAYLYGRYQIAGTSPKVPAPIYDQLSSPPGLCVASQEIKISAPNGAIARYTTDESDPTETNGTLYEGTPIPIASTTTLKVRYFKKNYQPSDVLTAKYTFDASLSFDPTGLKLWLRSDQGVTQGGTGVVSWADQSTFGNNATQATDASKPVVQAGAVNGYSTIKFDGSNDFLKIESNAVLDPRKVSIFVVASPNSTTSANKVFISKSSSNLGSGYGIFGYSTNVYGYVGTTSTKCGGSLPLNTYGIISTIFDPDKSSDQIRTSISMTSGGTPQTTVYTGNCTATINSDSLPLYLGSWNGSALKNNCQIAEVMIFDRAVSDQQRVMIENYLHVKYGIGPDVQLAPPTTGNLSAPGGTYYSTQAVSITVPAGQTARYTMDGLDPTANSAAYTGVPIPINGNTTLKIAFFKDGFARSEVLTQNYIIGFGGGGTPPTSGLMLWLRSDLGVLKSGDQVTQWADQSGHNNHAGAPAEQEKRPSLISSGNATINNLPVLHFDGAGDFMGVADNQNLRPNNLSTYVVGRYYKTKGAKQPFILKTSTNLWNDGFGIYRQTTGIHGFINTIGSKKKRGGNFADGVPGYFGLTYNGTAMNVSLNSSNFISDYNTALDNKINAPLMLAGDSISSYLQCDIAEVLFYDHALSETEIQKLRSYFYLRYFLGSLPKLPAPDVEDLSLPPGNYNTAQGVFITVPDGQQAYYTTDGTDPGLTSLLYAPGTPILLDRSATLKIRFYKSGYEISDVLSVPYTVGNPPPFPDYGLQVWLRADQGVTQSGGTVSAWYDQSGNGNNAMQTDSTKQPAFVTSTTGLNSQPVLRFDGSNDFLSIADTAALNASKVSVFVVASHQTGSGRRVFVTKSNSGLTNGYGIFKNGDNAYGFLNSYSTGEFGGAFPSGTYGLLSLTYDGEKAADQAEASISASINGTPQTTVYSGNYTTPITNDASPLYLGSWNGTALKNQCDIAEVILFNRCLSPEEVSQVRAYIFSRYGIGEIPSVPAPVLPTSRIFAGSMTVIMKGVSVGSIHYTTDGSTPTLSSPVYDSAHPPVRTATTTIKAKGFVDGWGDGEVTTRVYTKDEEDPLPTGPVLRLRADLGVGTVSGSNLVESWTDQSGNAFVALQDNANRQPTLEFPGAFAGRPVLHFAAGSLKWLSVADTPALNPEVLTVLLVGMQEGYNGVGRSVFFAKSTLLNNGYGLLRQRGDNKEAFGFYLNEESTVTNKVSGTFAPGKYFSTILSYDNYRLSFVKDGIPVEQKLLSAAISQNATPLEIGGCSESTAYILNGDIAELVIYDRVLTLAEQAKVQKYFKARYDLDVQGAILPSGAPTLPDGGAPPGYTDPNPNVAPNITITYPGNAVLLP